MRGGEGGGDLYRRACPGDRRGDRAWLGARHTVEEADAGWASVRWCQLKTMPVGTGLFGCAFSM
jgi:hypothetical protein